MLDAFNYQIETVTSIYQDAVDKVKKHQYSEALQSLVISTIQKYGDIGQIIRLVAQEIRGRIHTNTLAFSTFWFYTLQRLDMMMTKGTEITQDLKFLFIRRIYVSRWVDYLN